MVLPGVKSEAARVFRPSGAAARRSVVAYESGPSNGGRAGWVAASFGSPGEGRTVAGLVVREGLFVG